MKANEFVKKFGLKHSIEAVKNMPKDWGYCCLRIVDFEFQKRVPSIADFVDMDDLKRIVESHDLVESYGGIDKARDFISPYSGEQLNKKIYSPMLRLKQAIADVESCQ